MEHLSLIIQNLFKKGETQTLITEFQIYQVLSISILYIFALDSIYQSNDEMSLNDANQSLCVE